MDKIKKGLGRGLSSLIGEVKIERQQNQISFLVDTYLEQDHLFVIGFSLALLLPHQSMMINLSLDPF